nr:MAG TPA_asm: hypothetical protein [Bacteriophage sp.]
MRIFGICNMHNPCVCKTHNCIITEKTQRWMPTFRKK